MLRLLYGVAAAATYLILTSATPDGSILQLALALQMLSVLDVSVQITSTYSGYARGNLVARTLLSAPIIATACSSDFPAALRGLLAALRLRSPIVQRFRTMFEAPVPGVGQPLLPPAAIERIVQQHRDRGPVAEMEQLHNMAADFTNRVVGVLANDVPLSRHQLPRRGTMMPIGSAFVRASGLVPLSADSAAPLGSLSVRPARPNMPCYGCVWRHNSRGFMYVRAYRASKISPWKLACFLMPSHLAQGNLTRPQCLSSVTPIHNLNDIFTVPHAVFQLTLLHFQHAEYCKLRAEQFFSPFTLQPAYILTMYLLRQAQVWEQTYSAYVSHWVALQSMPETLCCRCYSDIARQRCWRSSSMRTGSGTQTLLRLRPSEAV